MTLMLVFDGLDDINAGIKWIKWH